MDSADRKISVLGIGVTNASETEVLEFIIRSLKKDGKKLSVVTINPEIIVASYKNHHFREVINSASLGLPDGIGVIWAAKILGKNLKKRIAGVDFMEKLCQRAVEEGLVVGFLGGGPKIALKTAECLRKKYPGFRVRFVGEEWPDQMTRDDRRWKMEDSILKIENRKSIHPQSSTLKNPPSTFYHPSSTIDILFVAFGFPKQELWIAENLPKIPVKMAMGVGGAFDFISGSVPRAPKWLQKVGLEWLFRLLVQPWRWQRQLALIIFIFLVLKERLAFFSKSINTKISG